MDIIDVLIYITSILLIFRSSSDTMSYLKAKRIPRLMSRTQNQDDSQSAKRHKGESYNSCK